ncbi:hypothetical protein EDB80DRAFT_702921 [Ilyonectria destructans]|nr:hypothetical protein EDB80DRAFT_702921 [Ilyonectria destructans]
MDKSSGVELQEAINSKFKWYEHAAIGVARLFGVSVGEDSNKEGSAFRACRWFNRA